MKNAQPAAEKEKLQKYDYLTHILHNKRTGDIEERTLYYNENWHNWIENRVVISLDKKTVETLRRNLWQAGLVEWQDYIFRHGKEIRFKRKEDAAFVKVML